MVGLGNELNSKSFTERGQLNRFAYNVSLACRNQINDLMENGWQIEPLRYLKVN